MFIGLGTVINVSAIILGSTLGIFFGAKFKESTRDLVTSTLGFVTLLAAVDAIRSVWNPVFASALPKGWVFLVILASLVIGALLGVALRIEERLENLGVAIKRRFDEHGSSPFVEGFVSSSLLFVIGPMAIMGSISDGMHAGISQLTLKSILAGITSVAFAASLGWGVAASALPVGIYQFAWTGIGFALGNILADYQVQAMTAVGGILLLGISFRLIRIAMIRVGTLLPSLFLAPLLAGAVHYFN